MKNNFKLVIFTSVTIFTFFCFAQSTSDSFPDSVENTLQSEKINEDVQGTITPPTLHQINSVEEPAKEVVKKVSKKQIKKSTNKSNKKTIKKGTKKTIQQHKKVKKHKK